MRQDSGSSSETVNEQCDEDDDTSNIQDEYLQNNGHVDFDDRQSERLSEVCAQYDGLKITKKMRKNMMSMLTKMLNKMTSLR